MLYDEMKTRLMARASFRIRVKLGSEELKDLQIKRDTDSLIWTVPSVHLI